MLPLMRQVVISQMLNNLPSPSSSTWWYHPSSPLPHPPHGGTVLRKGMKKKVTARPRVLRNLAVIKFYCSASQMALPRVPSRPSVHVQERRVVLWSPAVGARHPGAPAVPGGGGRATVGGARDRLQDAATTKLLRRTVSRRLTQFNDSCH